jgi:hypothetical protein
MEMNLREALHMVELRTMRRVTPTIVSSARRCAAKVKLESIRL